eukprot:scaffold31135_cov45-Phaeocystis_antarctica.AAC.3
MRSGCCRRWRASSHASHATRGPSSRRARRRRRWLGVGFGFGLGLGLGSGLGLGLGPGLAHQSATR